jgi:hypothetical protein
MRLQHHFTVAVIVMAMGGVFASVSNSPSRAEDKSATRFFCGHSRNPQTGASIPTTFAQTKRGSIAVVRWQSAFFTQSNYTPLKRCQSVSQRFETFYQSGELAYLTAGEMNNQNVICVSDEYGGPCKGLLLTLEPKDNPQAVLKSLLDARSRSGGPITRSTDSLYIDMEEYLETSPVEQPTEPTPAPASATP